MGKIIGFRILRAVVVALFLIAISVEFPSLALAQKPKLSILFFSSFVPANDEQLRKLGAEFGKERGVDVTVDFISIPEMYAKATAEAEAKAGHDIIGAENLMVAVHKESLLNIDDVIGEIIKKYGEFHGIGKEACFHDGHWKALPWWSVPFHGVYRMDYLQQVGETYPKTWEDVLRAAKKLKAIGHPVGFALSSCGDANNSLYQVMWAFGARIAEQDGTVAIDSPETIEALKYVKELYDTGMSEEVLAWDNAGNNRFILSGIGSWTLNPVSIYVIGKRDFPAIAAQLNHHGPLYGDRGRFGIGDFYSLMIWKFSKVPELAKDFLRYLYLEKNFNAYLDSGDGFNLPAHPYFDKHPVWRRDPKLEPIIGYTKYVHLTGWPAPPDARVQEVYQRFILPTMLAKVVTGRLPIKEAIEEAEKALVEVGYKPKKK